jgi:hypothetical protein
MATTPDYGGFTPDANWRYIRTGYGGSGTRNIVYNPNDPTQNFSVADGGQYLTELEGMGVQRYRPSSDDELVSTGLFQKNPEWNGEGNFGNNAYLNYLPTNLLTGGGKTLEEQAELKRLDGITQQISAGQVSEAKGNQMLNTPVPVPVQQSQPNKSQSGNSGELPPGEYVTSADGSETINVASANPAYVQSLLAAGGKKVTVGGGAKTQTQGASQPANDPLMQVYSQRQDLQALYNPDGSAKNPNDPRIAGIPTLKDWASQYGVNEEPLLKSGGTQSTQPETVDSAVEQKENYSKVLSKYGLSAEGEISDPVQYVKDIYSKVYSSLGVSSAKDQYDSYNKQLLDLRNKKTDEVSEINGNPWYTEGKRVGEVRKLDEKYAQKEANLIAFMTLANTMYENGIQQSQFVASNALSFVQDQQNFRQQLALSDINFQQNLQINAIEREQKMADARFALAEGMPFYKYEGNDTVYSTETGKPIPSEEEYKKLGGIGFTDVHEIKTANTVALQTQVLGLMQTYTDAGIRPSDTLDVAEGKVRNNSRIYAEQVRPPARAGGSGSDLGVLGLTNQQIDNISPLVTQFQNSPIVQNYNTIGEGYNFVRRLNNNTQNPADDQALIYALAKALDPGSVVREGEYATAQKYAQSMAQSYGKSVTQALAGTGFLSTDARKNIKSTIETKFRSAEGSYNNLYQETERRVNLVGNTDKGGQLLNNYGGAFVQPTLAGPTMSEPTTSASGGGNGGFFQKVSNWLFGD